MQRGSGYSATKFSRRVYLLFPRIARRIRNTKLCVLAVSWSQSLGLLYAVRRYAVLDSRVTVRRKTVQRGDPLLGCLPILFGGLQCDYLIDQFIWIHFLPSADGRVRVAERPARRTFVLICLVG